LHPFKVIFDVRERVFSLGLFCSVMMLMVPRILFEKRKVPPLMVALELDLKKGNISSGSIQT
jgi:hypothetical protein